MDNSGVEQIQPPARQRAVLAVFARLPVPGQVKTRLAAGASPQQAAGFYKLCAEHACLEVLRCPDADGVVFCAAAEDVQGVAAWLQEAGAALPVRPQVQEPDLGRRMIAALTAAAGSDHLQQQYGAAIVVGTDIPDLSSEVLSAAVAALLGLWPGAAAAADVVLGPAADGGYYLIGFRTQTLLLPAVQSCSVFEGVKWSSSSVLEKTVAGCQRAGLQVAACDTLPVLQDIDTLTDAAAWLAAGKHSSGGDCQPGGGNGSSSSRQQELQQAMRGVLSGCCNNLPG